MLTFEIAIVNYKEVILIKKEVSMDRNELGQFFIKVPHVVARYSQKIHGNMKYAGYREGEANREFLREKLPGSDVKMVLAKVNHGNGVTIVYSSGFEYREKVIETDVLVAANIEDLYLAVTFADCPFVFLVDPLKSIFAVAHCGWKPLISGILYGTFNKMLEMGADVKNIHAAIGPGICAKCYEFGKKDTQKYFRLYKKYIHYSRKAGKCLLDLKGIIEYQLTEELGINKRYLEISSDCTCCQKEVYFSYRGEKMDPEYIKAGMALIGLQKIKNFPA